MPDPKTEPLDETKGGDAANGEPDALESEDTHRSGERQAKENQENEPPA